MKFDFKNSAVIAICLLGTSSVGLAETCTGSADCIVCTNCSQCRYCSVPGQTCGVCGSGDSESKAEANFPEDMVLFDELNGFKLMQARRDVTKKMGAPSQTLSRGNLSYEVYPIGEDCIFYVSHLASFERYISGLQISGRKQPFPLPNGIQLGSTADFVLQRLGRPDSMRKLDSGETLLDYTDSSNISFELTNEVVSSIRISVISQFFTVKRSEEDKDILGTFLAAVDSKDPTKILDRVHPFGEIMVGQNPIMLDKPFSVLRKGVDSPFLSQLYSVRKDIEGFTPTRDFRMDQNLGFGLNFKYPEPCKVEKITFMPYNGTYRLYELWLRE